MAAVRISTSFVRVRASLVQVVGVKGPI